MYIASYKTLDRLTILIYANDRSQVDLSRKMHILYDKIKCTFDCIMHIFIYYMQLSVDFATLMKLDNINHPRLEMLEVPYILVIMQKILFLQNFLNFLAFDAQKKSFMAIQTLTQIYSTHMSTSERDRNFHVLQRMLDLQNIVLSVVLLAVKVNNKVI